MYKKILVPLDGSRLSNFSVNHAVDLARALNAQLVFFHVRKDFGSTSEGALLRSTSLESFNEVAAGKSNAILAKAESAARAAGVRCQRLDLMHNHPEDAILGAASATGADLILMASHGRRGLKGAMLGSVTQKVLQKSQWPVLIAATESNLSNSSEQRAIGVIKDEHRSLSAVVRGLQQMAKGASNPNAEPNFPLLWGMIYYIENFPEKLHHPKEEQFLFRLLKLRTHECDAVIDGLQQQHKDGAVEFKKMRDALEIFEQQGHSSSKGFISAVEAFSLAQWQHLEAEEKLILPTATQFLSEGDWDEIATAFLENGDPRFGDVAEIPFEELFTKISNLAAVQAATTTATTKT